MAMSRYMGPSKDIPPEISQENEAFREYMKAVINEVLQNEDKFKKYEMESVHAGKEYEYAIHAALLLRIAKKAFDIGKEYFTVPTCGLQDLSNSVLVNGMVFDGILLLVWCICTAQEMHVTTKVLESVKSKFPEFITRVENFAKKVETLRQATLRACAAYLQHGTTQDIGFVYMSFMPTLAKLNSLVGDIRVHIATVQGRAGLHKTMRNVSLASCGVSMISAVAGTFMAGYSTLTTAQKVIYWVLPTGFGGVAGLHQYKLSECNKVLEQLHELLKKTNESGEQWNEAFHAFQKLCQNIKNEDREQLINDLREIAPDLIPFIDGMEH